MDSDLLDLPLGVKIPVKPKSNPVFCRGKLGEKLYGLCPSFDLDDPYLHQLSLQYNCLHDPHLRDYHRRKDVLRLLKTQGFLTSDNKVVCTLKEFNEYRQYLTRIKLQSEQILGQQEEGLSPLLAKLKDGPRLPGTTDTSCQAKQRLQPQKPSCPPPQKSKEIPLKSGRFRREKKALDKGQTYPRAELGTAADSQRKPDNAAAGLFKAVFEQLTAAEAQKLQELVETVVHEVFVRLKVPQDQRVNFLRNTAKGIRGSIFDGYVRTEPAETPLDHCQKMAMVAKELLAMVLEILGNCLESKASEPGRAARQKEQPADGGATQTDKSKEAETASSHRARLHTCLDNLTRQVVKNVHYLLKSMVASQFEDSSYTEILELAKGKVSNRQMQQGFPGASKQQSQEARTGVKLSALRPQLQAEGTGYAKTRKPADPAMVKESLVREVNTATSGNTLDLRTMANQIVQLVLYQVVQHRPALTPKQHFRGPVPNPATSQGREESCAAGNTLGPRFSRKPVPPQGLKPPAQARGQRRSVHPKLF